MSVSVGYIILVDKKWHLSKQKRDLIQILRKDMEELVKYFWKMQ
jgi:hypothetical protein